MRKSHRHQYRIENGLNLLFVLRYIASVCGFLGRIGPLTVSDRERLLSAIIHIEHRGPDEKKTLEKNNSWFISTRLRVVGGATGEQPMNLESNSTLVYNGEITNFPSISACSSGLFISDNSDTFSLYKVLVSSQLDKIGMFEGHFAFAFWNELTSELIMCRDANGEKPLFYFADNEQITFSSSADALQKLLPSKPRLSESALRSYLRWGYIDQGESSMFYEIKQVPPGQILIWRKYSGFVTSIKFLTEKQTPSVLITDKSRATALLEREFSAVISRYLQADREVGVFLSGGLDSSLITSFAAENRKLKTFSVELPTSSLDSSRAHEIGARIGTEHRQVKFGAQDVARLLRVYVEKFDSPISDSGIFPLMKLVEYASSEVSVALAGEGGDEIFAGYPWTYAKLLRTKSISRGKISNSALRFLRRFAKDTRVIENLTHHLQANEFSNLAPEIRKQRFLQQNEFLSSNELSNLGLGAGSGVELVESFELKDALEYDRRHYLQNDLLLKSDRSSMAFGFELRLPFLAPSIVNFAQQLDEKLLIDFRNSKIILKELAAQRMPWIDWHAKKTGLGIPMSWLKTQTGFVNHLELLLSNKKLASINGMVNDKALIESSRKSIRTLWNLYMLLIWLEKRI